MKGIVGVNLNDETLAEISKLKYLEFLEGRGDGVTDRSLEPLLGMTRLRGLVIRRNQLTDTGFLRLAEHKPLTYLDVYWAQHIKPETIHEFHRLRPDCRLVFGNKTTEIYYPQLTRDGRR